MSDVALEGDYIPAGESDHARRTADPLVASEAVARTYGPDALDYFRDAGWTDSQLVDHGFAHRKGRCGHDQHS